MVEFQGKLWKIDLTTEGDGEPVFFVLPDKSVYTVSSWGRNRGNYVALGAKPYTPGFNTDTYSPAKVAAFLPSPAMVLREA